MFIHTFGDRTMACARLPGQKLCALITDSAAHLRHYLQLPRVPSVWKHQRQLPGHLTHGEYRWRLLTCVLPLPRPRSCCRLTLAFASESRLTEKFAITTRKSPSCEGSSSELSGLEPLSILVRLSEQNVNVLCHL